MINRETDLGVVSVETTRLRVEGMDCASCATKIENALIRMPGVTDVSVSVPGGTVTVGHDGLDRDDIGNRISSLGYRVASAESDGFAGEGRKTAQETRSSDDDATAWWRTRKGMLAIGSGIALAAAFALGKAVPATAHWAVLVAMLVGLVPAARRAIAATRAGTPFSIEMLMSIAAVGAVIIGATEEAATVVFLFLIGELLEGVAAGRARASIQGLTALVPKTARLEQDGRVRDVPADSLQVGATIQVRPGDRVPADGVVLSGESTVDEAPVTGESTPVRKGADGSVFAGTVNGDGLLRVRVTAAAADNTIARVVRLVEEAQESKAPTERFIDRFSRYYTPGVVVVAALVAVAPPLLFGGDWVGWIYKGLAVLLIGCPCALVISTPAAIAASLSAGARRGLLLKGGAVLEQIGRITVACFDKTGTLTAGKPQVTDIVGFARSEEDVLRMAAALESGSSHPLATAILSKAAEEKMRIPPASSASAIGGKGVRAIVEGMEVFLGSPKAAAELAALTEAQQARIAVLNDEGKTVSLLVIGEKIAGAIAMRDEPRPDAEKGLKLLSEAGIRRMMLTGDNRRTAVAIGRQLGIEVEAELLPEDKQRIVGRLQQQGSVVAKVGDGINDAPALAAADVGIAMGGGTDVALETADAAVLHGRVSDIAAMVDLSKRTMSNIRQNISIALGLKAVFLVTTVFGITGLWPAILADTGATVLVTLNALRLLRPSGG
ncbi:MULTISPECIES: heavy metal translocating P-type ATPase [unclassified Bradyrhizobium]|uniref:heavy metal translocating P-type ATPase n=1 Tax=unclassified Bradyrhizobium TaxID=2631580 RepID=UPI001FF983CC|nr:MULTISPECIES: heavy metal translocating P-type ATPase [unclassified Bradyrhizobium]MCK1420921.1 cadmium-translocating P-type ATPase [Bradyrhizobium sp. CW12]MCK1647413.1 cadmium-translocating P-type ATPase [Bradyrhizobium sp. 154]